MGRKLCLQQISYWPRCTDHPNNFRWTIAVIILLPILKKKEKNLIPPKDSIIPLFLMGCTGVALFNIFQFIALAKTSSINAGLISTLNPLSIAVSSALFLK